MKRFQDNTEPFRFIYLNADQICKVEYCKIEYCEVHEYNKDERVTILIYTTDGKESKFTGFLANEIAVWLDKLP